MADMGIGRLAGLTGVKIPTIRFYEQNGILAAPSRTKGGQRPLRRWRRTAATICPPRAQVATKLARLRLIRSELKRMIEACGGGSAAECRILSAIAHEATPASKRSRKARSPA